MTDVEVLRAAAARIRDVAAYALPAPWMLNGENSDSVITRSYGVPGLPVSVANASDFATAAWVALVNPELAEPLAGLLDQTAVQVAGSEEAGFDCRMDGSRYLPALKVADAVTGRSA